MPLYEYKCDKCGGVFEVIQKFADAPVTEHAECGGAVHRLISRSALQFKGSGWYVNDYAKSSSTPPSNGSPKKDDAPSKPPSAEASSTPAAATTSTGDTKPKS